MKTKSVLITISLAANLAFAAAHLWPKEMTAVAAERLTDAECDSVYRQHLTPEMTTWFESYLQCRITALKKLGFTRVKAQQCFGVKK